MDEILLNHNKVKPSKNSITEDRTWKVIELLEENCCKRSHINKTILGNSFGSQSEENTIACHLLFSKSSVYLSLKKSIFTPCMFHKAV
jgi:secreted trypsin-like serine protease